MVEIRHPEWRDELESTRYPFAATATLDNGNGGVILEGSFLDAHLYPIGAGEGLYLRSVELGYEFGTRTIADRVRDVCSGQFRVPNPQDNVRLTDEYGRPAGLLVSESVRLAMFLSWGIGVHEFEPEMTEFAATCCMPTPEIGVRGIQLADGSLLTGPVWLVGGDGVVLRHETVELPPQSCRQPGETVDVIRVDVVGDPLFRRRLCNPVDLFQTPRFVQRLAIRQQGQLLFVCEPDEQGNFSIQRNDSLAGDSAIRVRTTRDGVIFEVVGDNFASG
jgi:hypothetical protein